jgi:hypothetical protein
MALPETFGDKIAWQASWLDDNFNAVGACAIIPCTAAGTNTLVVTTAANTPVAAYANYQVYGFICPNTNSGAATANVGSLGAKSIYKDTGSGPAALAGNEMVKNNYVLLIYDSTLNTGSGGFHLQTAPASAAGTVTSVATNAGLTGGAVTTAGTIGLATIADHRVFANVSGGTAVPSANTLTDILDDIMSSTAGAILSRGASVWAASTEGSWTPAIAFGGASTGITYTTQGGQTFAIGNLTIATFNVVLSSKGSSTGSATISLPTTAGGGNRIGAALIVNYANLTSLTTVPWGYIAPSATAASLLIAGSATVTNMQDTNMANNASLAGIMAYFTA